MHLRIPALVVAVTAIAALNGCGSSTGIKAEFPNQDTSVTVYALNGTPVTVPTALRIRSISAVRIDGSFNFDVAFDIDAQGQVLVHTARVVAGQLIPARRVGLLFTNQAFDAVTRAPTGGYKYDTSYVMPVGKTLLVDSFDPTCSAYSILGQNIRAKMVLDSASLSSRAIFLRVLSDPNCGFQQLTPGTPKE